MADTRRKRNAKDQAAAQASLRRKQQGKNARSTDTYRNSGKPAKSVSARTQYVSKAGGAGTAVKRDPVKPVTRTQPAARTQARSTQTPKQKAAANKAVPKSQVRSTDTVQNRKADVPQARKDELTQAKTLQAERRKITPTTHLDALYNRVVENRKENPFGVKAPRSSAPDSPLAVPNAPRADQNFSAALRSGVREEAEKSGWTLEAENGRRNRLTQEQVDWLYPLGAPTETLRNSLREAGYTVHDPKPETADRKWERKKNTALGHIRGQLGRMADPDSANKQKLSGQDLARLDAGEEDKVRKAKSDFEKAKKAGDMAGMRDAHARAEAVRAKRGYSGGAGGDEYLTGKLTNEEAQALTPEGQTALKALRARNRYAAGEEELARAEQAERAILSDPAYQAEKRDYIRESGTPYLSPEQRQREGEQLLDIPKAIGTGIAGSFAGLAEAGGAALTEQRKKDGRNRTNTRQAMRNMEAELADVQERINWLAGDPNADLAEFRALTNRQTALMQAINRYSENQTETEEPRETFGQRMRRLSAEYRSDAVEGLDPVSAKVTQGLIGAGEMAPMLLASVATGGATLPAMATLGVQTAGGKAGELLDQGESGGYALGRGLASGGIAAGTGVLPYGRLMNIVKGPGGASAKALGSHIASAVGMAESDLLANTALDRALGRETEPLTPQALLDTASNALIVSAIMGGGGAALRGARDAARGRTGRTAVPERTLTERGNALAEEFNRYARERADVETAMRRMSPEEAEAARPYLESLDRREAAIRQELEALSRENTARRERETAPAEEGTPRAEEETPRAEEETAPVEERPAPVEERPALVEERPAPAEETGAEPNGDLFDARTLPLSPDERTRAIQEKLLRGEPLTMGERLGNRDGNTVVKALGDYDLKPDHAYRVVSEDLWEKYKTGGEITRDIEEYIEGENNAGVDWYLGGASTRYGAKNPVLIVLEAPARRDLFQLAADAGTRMVLDPMVRHIKSSPKANPVQLSDLTNVFRLDKATGETTRLWGGEQAEAQRAPAAAERAEEPKAQPAGQTEQTRQTRQPEPGDPLLEAAGLKEEAAPRAEEAPRGGEAEPAAERKTSPAYGQPENHIDRRTAGSLGDRNVKAFQWDHPELKPFYAEAARALMEDVGFSQSSRRSVQKARGVKAERLAFNDPRRRGGTFMAKNDILKFMTEDMGLTTPEIMKACEAIIHDEGQENYAAAKRVELALDRMLSEGYTPVSQMGDFDAKVPPNEAYLQAKEAIEGARRRDSFEYYRDRAQTSLDLGEVTEEQLYREWQEKQAAGGAGAMPDRPDGPERQTGERGYGSKQEELAALQERMQTLLAGRDAIRTREEADRYNAEMDRLVRDIQESRTYWEEKEGTAPAEETESNRNPAEEPGNVSGEDPYSVGAAPSGFDPFSNWQEQNTGGVHPINEAAADRMEETRGRARQDVPILDPQGRNVSKAFSTLLNAGIVPNDAALILEENAVRGDYSYDRNTDRAALARARQTIQERGFRQSLADWRAGLENGRYGKDQAVLGIELMNRAMNSGTPEGIRQGIDIAADHIHAVHDAASALQAQNLINRLTPEGQLYALSRTVDKINTEATERRERGGAQQELDFLRQSREDALNVIRETIEAFADPARQARQDQTDWVTAIGRAVGKRVGDRLNAPGAARPEPVFQTIVGDLMRFAEEHALPDRPAPERQQRTAADRIADYFANREEYSRAWETAKREVRERYRNDPESLEAFEDWLNSTISYNAEGSDAVMLRAILDSARDLDQVDLRTQYDPNALGDEVFNRLNETVRAEGPDAVQLRNAVQRWVNERGMDMEAANQRQLQRDMRNAMRELGTRMSEIIRRGDKEKAGVANTIRQMLADDYGMSWEGAQAAGDAVLERFDIAVREASERALASMFKNRNSRRARTAMERLEELTNLGAFTSDEFAALASEKVTGYRDAVIDPELAKAFVDAETPEARRAAKEAIYRDVARQVPPTWRDKFNAWRYLAMLGNPRTQGRNMVGNGGFQPVRITKDVVGAGLERIAGLPTEERTKAVKNYLSAEDRARFLAGKSEFPELREAIMAGGKYRDDFTEIDQYRRIFRNPVIEGWRKATNWGLEEGDAFFSSNTYADALAGVLKARGITAAEYMSPDFSPERKAEIQGVASREAQRATYRDTNAFSQWVSRLGRGPNTPKAIQTLVEGILPFKKTPANILARAVDYSPIGLATSIADLNTRVRRGEMTLAEGLDGLAAGLTGTGLLGLGFFLAGQGRITGGGTGDSAQDDFNDLQGIQDYAWQTEDGDFTLDWLAPEALPVFVGVELFNSWNRLKGGDTDQKNQMFGNLLKIADPMLEMSMLQSLNDVIDAKNSDFPLATVVAQAAASYLTQFVPTVFGQAERTLEDTRQTTWLDRDSVVPRGVQYLLGRTMNKLPGEFSQREYVDAWGRTEETGNVLERALNNFLNPSYTSTRQTTDVDRELQRLHDAGFDGVFPTLPKTNVKVNDSYLTAESFNQLARTRGQTAYDTLSRAMNSPMFQEMTDEERAAFVKKVFDFSGQIGKLAVGEPEEKADSFVRKARDGQAEVGLDPAEYLAYAAMRSAIDKREDLDATGKAVEFKLEVEARDDLTEEQKAYITDNLKFFRMVPADTKSFDRGVDAGLTADESKDMMALKKRADADGNGSLTNLELYEAIRNNVSDEEKQAQYWNAMKASNNEKSWSDMQDSAAKEKQKAEQRSAALSGMDGGKADAFDAAAKEYGKNSYHDIYTALMSVDATDAERAQYYEYVRNQRARPWHKSWAQVKTHVKNGG